MEVSCKVWFDNDSTKVFNGFWKDIIIDINNYCERNELETIQAIWY